MKGLAGEGNFLKKSFLPPHLFCFCHLFEKRWHQKLSYGKVLAHIVRSTAMLAQTKA